MNDITTENESQPHAVSVVLTTGGDIVHVPVGTFPNWEEAASASNAALKATIDQVENSPMAGSVTVHTTIVPAPADVQDRIAFLLTVFKEDQDERKAWAAGSRIVS